MSTAAMPSAAASLQSFLAFDVGRKRTGVAFGTRMLGQAQPQGTVKGEGDARWPQIAQHIQTWQPDALVVGVPFHPDGAEHENTCKPKRACNWRAKRRANRVFSCSAPSG